MVLDLKAFYMDENLKSVAYSFLQSENPNYNYYIYIYIFPEVV